MPSTKIVSSGALIDALREFRLLSTAQLAELSNAVHGRSGDARALAKLLARRSWLTVYQINQVLEGNARELVIGPYHVLDCLGKGGLSQVFKAKHTKNGNVVALKMLRADAMSNAEGRRQFLHEIEAMTDLDHPNIVQFCDVDQVGETFYFCMEYVEGTDLGKHVGLSGPLPIQEACEYIRQAAVGLQHAHEHNLVHRDIKPVNLFLTYTTVHGDFKRAGKGVQMLRKRPLIKILDWGLAGLRYPGGQTPPEAMENLARGIIGTVDYLSPEQARDAHSVDIRGDIYSLGCTLYFLLTGEPPFPTGTLMQKVMQHQQSEPAPLISHREDVPREVEAVLKRMLAKSPEARFQTPAAVAMALTSVIRGDGIEEEAAERKPRQENVARKSNDTPLPRSLTPHISKPRRHSSDATRGLRETSDTSFP